MRLKRIEELTDADIANWPKPRELTREEAAEVVRLFKEQFTAGDLQEFTELDEGVPLEQVLREMEETQKQGGEKRQ